MWIEDERSEETASLMGQKRLQTNQSFLLFALREPLRFPCKNDKLGRLNDSLLPAPVNQQSMMENTTAISLGKYLASKSCFMPFVSFRLVIFERGRDSEKRDRGRGKQETQEEDFNTCLNLPMHWNGTALMIKANSEANFSR